MVPTIIKEGTREVTTSRNVAGRASRAIVMEASAYLAAMVMVLVLQLRAYLQYVALLQLTQMLFHWEHVYLFWLR